MVVIRRGWRRVLDGAGSAGVFAGGVINMRAIAQARGHVLQVAAIGQHFEMAFHGRFAQVEAGGKRGNGCTADAVAHLGIAPDDAVGGGCHKPARVADLVEEGGETTTFPLTPTNPLIPAFSQGRR